MSAHKYILEQYEGGISRGECACGSVQFYVNDIARPDWDERAAELNKKEGKLMEHRNGGTTQTAAPTKQRGGNNRARHMELLAHRDEILSDIKVLGEDGARRKRDISSTGWLKMRRTWLKDGAAPSAKRKYTRHTPAPAKNETAPGKRETKTRKIETVTLPPWNESWGDSVKVEWLKSLASASSRFT